MRRRFAALFAAAMRVALALASVPLLRADVLLASTQLSDAASGPSATVSVSAVDDVEAIAVLALDGDYSRLLADGSLNAFPRQELARAFYATHADELDFLLVVTDFSFDTGEATAVAWRVQNQVSGIGLPIFDESASFGSAGRLFNYVDLGPLSRYDADPTSPGFERLLVAATHEILHTWGADVRFRAPDGSLSDALTATGAHWSYLFDSHASVLYGNDWRDDGDGSFTSLAADKVWGPLDLYVAGLLAPEEVPPLMLIENATVDPARRGRAGDRIDGVATVVTIDDIVAAEGPREPAAADAPRAFRAGIVYVVRPGEQLDPAEQVALEAFRRALEIRFAVLTGGRASLAVHVDSSAEGGDGGPGGIDGGEIRPGPASLSDALAWLRERQAEDGSWQDLPETRARDTAAAAGALARLDSLFSGISAARAWLESQAMPSTDFAARRAAVAELLGYTTGTGEILARQNPDGGWGAGNGFGSDPLDTALAVSALRALRASVSSSELRRAGDYLLGAQNADGGWGASQGGVSRTATTVLAICALAELERTNEAGVAALAWLAARQNSDGGFGDSPSTAHDTAAVLESARRLALESAIDESAAIGYLTSRQTVDGSWEGSVYTTALVVEALALAALPDLTFAAPPIANPLEPVAGESVRLTIAIRNEGSLAAPATELAVYDGDPSAGGAPIGPAVAVPELAAAAQTTVSVSWESTGAAAGDHDLYFALDAGNAIAEASESNNRAVLTVTVQPSPEQADLTVRGDEIAFLPPAPALLPSPISIVVTVRNLGAEDVSSAMVRAYRGDSAAGSLVGEQSVVLLARSSLPVSFGETLTQPGTTLYTVVVDPDGAVAEADETNNLAAATITTTPAIDLALSTADLEVLDAVHPGADVRLRARVHNRGTVGGGSFDVDFAIADSTSTTLLQRSTMQVEAGEIAERTVVWRVDKSGSLRFVVTIDPQNLVPEVDESNNLAELELDSTPLEIANLAVAPPDLSLSPLPAREGEPLTLSLLVRNNGGFASESVRVAFFDGLPSSGLEIASTTLQPLEAGEAATATAVWAEVPDAADRILHVVVDPDDTLAEFSKADNATFAVAPIHSLPDLAVTSGGLTLAPAVPIPGEAVTLSVQVVNLGEQPASDVVVRAFLGTPETGGTLLGETVVAEIVGLGSAVETIVWTFADATDRVEIHVRVDPDGLVRESDETNNAGVVGTAVQDGSFYVDAPYFSPNGDGVLDTSTFSFRLEAPRAVAVEIRDAWDRTVRREVNASWDAGGGELTWDGSDDRGAIARDGDYHFVVIDRLSSETIGAARAVLDTNRSSLLAAVGTRYERLVNATCDLPFISDSRPTVDGRSVYVAISSWDATSEFPEGIHRVSTATGRAQSAVLMSQLAKLVVNCPRELIETSLTVSPDGSHIAFATWRDFPCASRREAWVADATGSSIVRLPEGTKSPWGLFPLIGFYDEGRKLLAMGSDGDLRTIDVANPTSWRVLFPDADSLFWSYDAENFFFSPDREALVLFSENAAGGSSVWLFDLGSETPRHLVDLASDYPWQWENAAWSFDGRLIVVNDPAVGQLHLFDPAGEPRGSIEVRSDPPAADVTMRETRLARTRVSTREVALSIEWSSGARELVVVDLASEAVRHVAWLGDAVATASALRVDAEVEGSWREVGALAATDDGAGSVLRLPRGVVNAQRTVRLRVSAVQEDWRGGSIELVGAGRRRHPDRAGGGDESSKEAAQGGSRRRRELSFDRGSTELAFDGVRDEPLLVALTPESSSQTVITSLEADVDMLEIEAAGEPCLALFSHPMWVPFDRAVLWAVPERYWYGESMVGVLFDEGDRRVDLFADWMDRDSWGYFEFPRFSDDGQSLFFESGHDANDVESPCYDRYGRDLYTLSSLLNLGAELEVRTAPSGVGFLFEGTAADRNFLRYQLDYARGDEPGAWTTLAPATAREVFGDTFTTWVAPAPGEFLVRLHLEDRAGNQRDVVRRVYSTGNGPSATDLWVTPPVFSPNGDGILERATIHYRALEPVHVETRIIDSEGTVVRAFPRSHAAPEEAWLDWDGRNDAGRPVRDGVYAVRIQDLEQLVEVDNTPPAASLDWRPERLFCGPNAQRQDRFASWELGLLQVASDGEGRKVDAELEAGFGADPQRWFPALLSAPDAVSPECTGNCLPLAPIDFVDRSYRLTATDEAGNERVVTLGLGGESIDIGAIKTEEADVSTGLPTRWSFVACSVAEPEVAADGLLRLEVGETIRANLSQIFVQYRAAGSPLWSESPAVRVYEVGSLAPAAALPEHYFDLAWDPTPIVGVGDVDLRLRSLDLQGVERHSGIVRLRVRRQLSIGAKWRDVAPVHLSASEDPVTTLFEQARKAGAIEEGPGLFLVATVESSLPPESVAAYVRSDEDARYTELRRLEPLHVLATEGLRLYLFHVEDARLCTRYTHFATAGLSTGTAVDLRTSPADFKTPCFGARLELSYDRAETCGEEPSGAISAQVAVTAKEEIALQLLTLSRLASDGSETILASVNQPEIGASYTFALPVDELADDLYQFSARLSSVDGESHETTREAIIDRLPPEVEISYPGEGQQLCLNELEVVGTSVELNFESALRGIGDDPDPKRWTKRANVLLSSSNDPAPFSFELGSVPAGPVRLRLAVWDKGGNLTCSERSFAVDAAVAGALSASESLISPNGDGFRDRLSGAFVVGKPLTVEIAVRSAATGSIVRLLLPPTPVADLREFSWEGENDALEPQPDGDYTIVVSATDGCGNAATWSWAVEIDRTPPTVLVTSPSPVDPLPMIVPIAGIATDRNFSGYRLEFGVGSDPATWQFIASGGERPPPGGSLGLWNTFGLEGEYTLRLSADDLAGNASEQRVSFTLTGPERLISNLEAVPSLFSPNSDDRRESTALRVAVERSSNLTLTVHDEAGNATRSLATDELVQPGVATWRWDGLRVDGTPAADATYHARLLAEYAENTLITQEEEIEVVLDRTAPAIVIERPRDGFASGSGEVIGTITDLHIAGWSVALTDRPEAPVWKELANGTTNRSSAPLGSLEGLAEGDYALRIYSVDAGETESEQVVSLTIDNTPPGVELLAPGSGAVLSLVRGAVAVRGRIVEEHLRAWRLEIGAGASPSEWLELAAGELPPAEEILLEWLPSGVADGLYTIRLSAEDLADHEVSDSILVTIDNAPPEVAIAAPVAGSWVREPTAVLGTAIDTTLESYVLSLAPDSSVLYSPIGGGSTPVVGSQLALWSALPADGAYRLRLAATDRAGNQSATEIGLLVDTHPPGPPTLWATLENGDDARLLWTASPEPDVVGYVVERDGARLTATPVTTTDYLDPDLAEGNHIYRVRAVDVAGWEGEPSEPAGVAVDRTPPLVALAAPSAGALVAGSVEIVGTAYSEGDFREYRLWAQPAGGEASLLRRSPAPVVSSPIATWSTSGLLEGTVVTLRLEAEDLIGNVGAAEVAVTVDNLPPAPPSGLVAAVVSGTSDVQTSWNANAEADLLGYLLYRDGVLVNAAGGDVDDLRSLALTTTSYRDAARPDGTFTYAVVAIDRAGNASAPSNPAAVTIDRRPPHAVITVPAAGVRFDRPLYVRAETADEDIAEVAFEWTTAGASAWTVLAAPDAVAPWETSFDPGAFEPALAFGDYELRAVASDRSGTVDPAPTSNLVTYVDVTPPAVPLDLEARVDGSEVRLDWTANVEPDLAGYHVDRTDLSGATLRRTAAPVSTASFVDAGVVDGRYSYVIIAVDTEDNESAPSDSATAEVATPLLVQPFSPTRQTVVDLLGASPYAGIAHGEIVNALGATPLGDTATDLGGAFVWSAIPLELGTTNLRARVSDTAGNRTNWAEGRVAVGVAPAPPTDLVAVYGAGTYDVELTWSASGGPDVVGYRLWRNGQAVPSAREITDAQATASTWQWSSPPDAAIDGDPDTAWEPYADDANLLVGQRIEVSWPAPRLLNRVELLWREGDGWLAPPIAFDLEAWFDDAWVPLLVVRDNFGATQQWAGADLYPTDRLRVVVRETRIDDAGFELALQLAELLAVEQPLLPGMTHSESVPDGRYEYRVEAIAGLGFVSAPAVPANVDVGDVEPPDAVALTATVAGSDVALAWTASAALDLARYDVYRDGVQLGEVSDLDDRNWLDAGLPNGTYRYVVSAVDQVGNPSPPSNEEVVTVAVAPPSAPSGLVVAAVIEGEALDLSWQPPTGPVPAAYVVHRAIASGGPYAAVGVSASPLHRDAELVNGTTYYYVVTAADELDNESAPSNEASGTPRDGEAPLAPRLVYPARPGAPRITGVSPTVVAGFATPGDEVELWRNGSWAGETVAAAAPSFDSIPYSSTVGEPQLSPDGGWLWTASSSSETYLVELTTGVARQIFGESGKPRWASSSREIYLASNTTVRRYDVVTASPMTVATLEQVLVAKPSPDGERLAIVGRRSGLYGLWLYELASGGWSRLVATASLNELWDSVEWSPDGARLAYVRLTPSRAVEIWDFAAGAVVTSLPAVLDPPSWSPDGSALLWTSSATGSVQIWRHDLATGSSLAVTSGPASHADPQWSPEANRFAAITSGNSLVEVDLTTGSETVWRSSTSELFAWTRSGLLLTRAGSSPLVVTPPGRFAIDEVALDEGDNRLVARARDAAGNLSPPSEETVVHLLAGTLPNLAVLPADLVVLPTTPLAGSTARVTAVVRNLGGVVSPATELTVAVSGPQGITLRLADAALVPALGPGATTAFGLDLDLPPVDGAYSLSASVDAAGVVAEASEVDNVAERGFLVASFASPQLALSTDRSSYGADENVLLSAVLTNAGERFEGTLELAIVDAQGELVEALAAEPIVDLDYGAQVEIDRSWWSGAVFAGTYQVTARLLDAATLPVAEAVAPFTVGEQIYLTTMAAADRSSYLIGATARLTGTLRYAAGNVVLADADAELRVLDAGDSPVANWQRTLGDLLPGTEATIVESLATGELPPGDYRLRFEVTRSGEIVASAETPFQLLAQPASLAGALALSNRQPALGESLVVTYSVSNVGGNDAIGVPIRVRLLAAASRDELGRSESLVDLPAGSSREGSAAFATDGLKLAGYLVVLEATWDDGGGPAPQVLAAESFTTADRTPPEARLVRPEALSLLGADLQARASASDRHSALAAVEVAIDAGEWLPLSLEDAVAGLWGAALPPLAEGAHAAALRARDAWDNLTELAAVPFEVDLTPPLVAISGVEEGAVYPLPVWPTFTVEDLHPGWSLAQLDGAAFRSGTAVDLPGAHTLRVVAADAAGNRTTASVSFTIELASVEPEILVADATAIESSGQLVFVVSLSAASPQPITVEVATVDGTAVAPADYAAVTGVLTLPAGAVSGLVVVPVVDEALDENDEQFELRLANPVGATLVDSVAVGTIRNDDAPPALSLGDGSVNEGDEGTVELVLPLTLSAPSGLSVEVGYQSVEGTATPGVDYIAFSGHLTIPANETAAEIHIEVVGDRSDERDESFTVVLTDPQRATVADGEAIATILDDDLAQLAIDDVATFEGDGGTKVANFTVSAAEPVAESVSVDFATVQDSASEGSDYLATSGTLTLAAGESSASIPVEVVGDTWFEEDERYFVRLSNPTAAALVDDEGVGTIRNDEGCASVNLLANGSAELVLPDGAIASWIEVEGDWQPRWGSPTAAAGKAYFDAPADLFAELVQARSLAAYDRWLRNGNGTLLATGFVRLAAPGGRADVEVELLDAAGLVVGNVLAASAVGAAVWMPFESEVPVPPSVVAARVRLLGDGYFDGLALRVFDVATFVVGDGAIVEPDSGIATLVFPLSLSCPIEPVLRFAVATVDGTATAPADYEALTSNLTLPRGAVATTVPVAVAGDSASEGMETFHLDLVGGLSVPWVLLADGRGTGTIVDDDFCQGTIGFWGEHPAEWAFSAIRIGAVLEERAALEAYLRYTGGDMTYRLAQQLVATRLNLARGADPAITSTVDAADAFLVAHPLGSSLDQVERSQAEGYKNQLDKYNNGCKKR